MLINNKGKFIRHVGGNMLVPGINKLTEEQGKAFTARINSNKLDAFLVSSKELVEVKNGEKSVDSITDMKVNEATDLVGQTASIDTLTAWLADEKRASARKGVIQALTDRLDVLQPKTEDTETEE